MEKVNEVIEIINRTDIKYKFIMFVKDKLKEMETTEQNKVVLYLVNGIY